MKQFKKQLDRWLQDLRIEEPVYFWVIAAAAVGFVLIIVPMAIFHLLERFNAAP